MGKFDGLLLCTDLDDTLLTTDKKISDENRNAIEYFKSEGGLFTFATGRIPHGARLMLQYIKPNVPMICFNGAGIYDHKKEQLLWKITLDEDALEVLEFVDKNLPFSGIEVCTPDELYFCKVNRIVEEHQKHEHLPDLSGDYHNVPMPWMKVLFMQEASQVDEVRSVLQNTTFKDKYEFIQSSPNYYELLPKNASKGNALRQLAKVLDIPMKKVIAIGDNENDISMIKEAGMGVAVSNAIEPLKKAADCITVDNNSHAIAAVISSLADGLLFESA
ncbi:MAG: Cof-type HAD-IIB family hydrolase [Clostridia bacterium]|nr:Cof-type HAD-IIB family hydrolase [Clostridia bacterium]